MDKCIHCGFDVFWAFARKDDLCVECSKPIGMKMEHFAMLEDDRGKNRGLFDQEDWYV